MQIQPAQMAALTAQRLNAYMDRLTDFVEKKMQRKPEREAMDALFKRGTRYGLVTEQQFTAYILLTWAAGARPEVADPAWIAEVMIDAYRMPSDKIAAIFERAGLLQQRRV